MATPYHSLAASRRWWLTQGVQNSPHMSIGHAFQNSFDCAILCAWLPWTARKKNLINCYFQGNKALRSGAGE